MTDVEQRVGAGAGNLPPNDQAVVDTANAALAAMAANPGFCQNFVAGTPAFEAVKNFKTAYLAAYGSGVVHNGEYDQATVDAIVSTLPGAKVPGPCGGVAPPPPAKTCPQGQHLENGNCVPDAQPVPAANSKKWLWWLVGIVLGLAVVGGGWWVIRKYGSGSPQLTAGEKKKKGK